MKTILELETHGLRAVGLFVLVAVLALGAPGALAETASSRLLAIGDIHGDYEALVAILQEAHIVDSEGNWVAGTPFWSRRATFWIEDPKCGKSWTF